MGLLLVIAERFTNPQIRLALRRPEPAALEMSQWGLALCMAAAFFFSRSLALVLLLHWLLAAATLPMERAALRGPAGGESAGDARDGLSLVSRQPQTKRERGLHWVRSPCLRSQVQRITI